jgi:hypothetical protein
VIGYRFHCCGARSISDDPRREGKGSALEPPPNGAEVSEIEAMRDRSCGARVQGGEHFAAQEKVIGRRFKLSGGVA